MLSFTLDLRAASFEPALERKGTRLETFVRHSFNNSGSLTIFLSSLIFFVNPSILSFFDFEPNLEEASGTKKSDEKSSEETDEALKERRKFG